MKSIAKKLALVAAMASPLAALAAGGGGLLGGVHDFATNADYLSTQMAGDGVTPLPGANSVGLCSYCHTPHSALSTTLLWNHKLSTNSFTWDDATTQAGTAYPTLAPTYKGTSVKCLSCHDGSVAVGDVNLYKDTTPANFNTFKVTGYTMIANGASMSKNHPIGMPYPFGQVTNTYNGVASGANTVWTEFVTDPVNQNSTKIKLYNDSGTGLITQGAVAGKSGIECSSCHDVHDKSSVDEMLLRGKIEGSTAAGGYICLQCHTK